MLTLTCLGGAGTVTGAKFLLHHQHAGGHTRLLIDCGLFQGLKNLREQNWRKLPVAPRDIDAVILTHGHLDHCGYLPRLVADGFAGRIYASDASCDIAALILRDSAWLQEKEAERANRKGYSKHQPAQPLYRLSDAEAAIARFKPVPWGHEVALPGDARLLLRRAGHILGAASVQIDIGGQRVVCSGDLGRWHDPVMPNPELVPEADHVLIESTYGNRCHETGDAVSALGDIIQRTVQRGGTVVIPAFAVGRTQALIHDLWLLRQRGQLQQVPIYLDSPMATTATELLQRHPHDHRLPAADFAAACAAVTFVADVEDSKALASNRYPKVILSASGMATGGRVLHHLAAFAGDHRNTLLFSGFQAAGTRGRKLLEGAREVKIYGRWITVNAEVANIPMLSAHADRRDLLRWLDGFERPPRQVFVVHGEPEAADSLREAIQRELGWTARVPLLNETLPL